MEPWSWLGLSHLLRVRLVACGSACVVLLGMHSDAWAETKEARRELTIEQRALVFGQLPALWRPQLSPDGSRAVMITQPGNFDLPVAVVHDFATGKSTPLIASEKDEFDLVGCRWANEDRLLCRYLGIAHQVGVKFGTTRLVAVDADGTHIRVLMQRQMRRKHEESRTLGQFQDRVVDWLPDDEKHVLIQEPDRLGAGLSKLEIYSGRLSRVKRARDFVRVWMTDGNSEPRVRLKWTDDARYWQHSAPGESRWKTLDVHKPGDPDDGYEPIGFMDDPDRLLSFRDVDGRQALVSDDVVGDGARITLFSSEEADVSGLSMLGPHDRIVAATWHTDRPRIHYFDPSLDRVHAAVAKALPGKTVVIEDESWDREIYLVFAYSDVDPGTWYRLDLKGRELKVIESHRPAMRGVALAPMESMVHTASDGTEIPGYVTRPVGSGEGPLPTVVLPHGGPESRDTWGFDWLAQFMAANGYVVFQTNYRGSAGYGVDWIGNGGFQSWHLAVSDIDSGVQHLIDEGISDPSRICAVGWSYGAYASLLSALEHPERYKCVVDIAGVADPRMLVDRYKDFINKDFVKSMVSNSDHVMKDGSPLKRAREFQAPVLIFHPEEDLNVDVKQGRKFAKALKKAGKLEAYVEYEDDEHAIWRHASRIDMLTRIGRFLDEHIGAGAGAGAAADTQAAKPAGD